MPPKALDTETLKELREQTRLFLKLDLAYLAAGGAILTALKVGRSELLELGAHLLVVVSVLGVVSLVDVVIDSLVFSDWFSARTEITKRRSPRLIGVLMGAQPFFHFCFVATLLSFAVGYSSGVTHARAQIEGRVMVQEAVEAFMRRTGAPPKSFQELQNSERGMTAILLRLDGEGVKVEATGPKSYRITFAGWDKTFGTDDDEVVTQELSLRKVFDSLSSESKPGSPEK